MKNLRNRWSTTTVLGVAALLVLSSGGGAIAAGLITSADIMNHTIRGVDI